MQAEWEKLDEETRFFRTNEDPFKEPRVVIENKVALKEHRMLEDQLGSIGEQTEDNAADHEDI